MKNNDGGVIMEGNFDYSKATIIEFNLQEQFTRISASKTGYLALTLITDGNAILTINGKMAELKSPCILASSSCDTIVLVKSDRMMAKSLRFYPTLINKSLTFENLATNDFCEIADRHDSRLLRFFLMQDEAHNRIIKLLPQTYLRVSEWFSIASKETKIKKDAHWLYRVRRCLMQILLLLEDTCTDSDDVNSLSDERIVDIVLEYMHANFANEISLDSICRLVYVNRTSLTRKFKAHTHRSPINYLLHYRLSVACNLLTNSKLSISKIADTTGFKYESYFTRQFTAKIGITPTQYRQSDGYEVLNIRESSIVDEF